MMWACDYTKEVTDPDADDGMATIYVDHIEDCWYRLELAHVGDVRPELVCWLVGGLEVGNGNPFVYEFPKDDYYQLRATWYDDYQRETTAGRHIICEE